MDGSDRVGEDRPFRIDFEAEGVVRSVKERVAEKLEEFIGDYTDDTLVEYVIVLLRNGRNKGEARRELDVFLGDDSTSFVSWLWEHLSSNLHLYEQSKESSLEEMFYTNRTLDNQSGKHDSQTQYMHGDVEANPENKGEKLTITSGIRRNREWKGLLQEQSSKSFPLQGTTNKILHTERDSSRPNVRRSLSPKRQIGYRKSQEDDQQQMKRDAAPRPVISATRRLLQFAVRDAVRTVQQTSSKTELALKRLRSVVSTSASTSDSLVEERPQKLRSVAKVPGSLSTTLKADADAAEYVINKDRYVGSVFDRLSYGVKESSKFAEHLLEEGQHEDRDLPESNRVGYYQRREYDGDFTGDTTMLERYSVSDDGGYSNAGIFRHKGSQNVSSANKDKNSWMLNYGVAHNADEVVRNNTRLIDKEPTGVASKASSKIVNISVNVNTWQPPHHCQVAKDFSKVVNRVAVDKSGVISGSANSRLSMRNNTIITQDEISRADVQKEPQKTLKPTPGSNTSSRPSDDVDSRTVFVSNVHFASTKDTLSRHFNMSGEVRKVIIVTDAATGQPKGSAYVEFLRKESAESALSLNGTSFMSRILKVVRKSSMHHEAMAPMCWPGIARASPFASRLSRVPFLRGVVPSAFRARLPIKPGARSLQWKREGSDPQTSSSEAMKTSQSSFTTAGTNVPSLTGRNLTYIRPESRAGASSGQT